MLSIAIIISDIDAENRMERDGKQDSVIDLIDCNGFQAHRIGKMEVFGLEDGR
jgi:hypothetical protein